MSRELARLHMIHCPPLAPGEEWWTDTPHALAVRVRREEAQGRIVELARVELAPGVHGSLIHRLKPRPPAWRGPFLVVTGLALVGVAVTMVWPFLLALGAGWVAWRLCAGHKPTCAGLHCPGCRH
jgi:hypothetical protein